MAGQHERGERAQRVGPGGQPAHRARGRGGVVLAHVQVAIARELHDPPLGHGVGGELLVMDRDGARHIEAVPADVAQSPGEVDLVGVDEEVGVEIADLLGGVAPDEQRGRLAPVDFPGLLALALDGDEVVQEQRSGEGRRDRREGPGGRLAAPVGAP